MRVRSKKEDTENNGQSPGNIPRRRATDISSPLPATPESVRRSGTLFNITLIIFVAFICLVVAAFILWLFRNPVVITTSWALWQTYV